MIAGGDESRTSDGRCSSRPIQNYREGSYDDCVGQTNGRTLGRKITFDSCLPWASGRPEVDARPMTILSRRVRGGVCYLFDCNAWNSNSDKLEEKVNDESEYCLTWLIMMSSPKWV